MKRMTVNEIKKELEGAKGERLQKLLSLYRQDPRSSVAALVKKQERKLEKLKQEYRRLEEMTEYERRYEQMDLICGIDEAGRGLWPDRWWQPRSFCRKTAGFFTSMIRKSFLPQNGRNFMM